jgi:methylmalonyl-CoA mutase N-terminal domain/subunit
MTAPVHTDPADSITQLPQAEPAEGILPDSISRPGEYPFTRGIHPTMYQQRLWTMRQFAGFGSAEHTNERFKYLLNHGQTGLSTAFDLPTLMGRDGDDPLALGEVGKCGVAVSCLTICGDCSMGSTWAKSARR